MDMYGRVGGGSVKILEVIVVDGKRFIGLRFIGSSLSDRRLTYYLLAYLTHGPC